MKAKYFSIVVACLMVMVSCNSDNIALNKGDQFYAKGEYYTASLYYKKAYQRTPAKDKPKRGQRALKMADCYRRINYAAKAVAAYQNAVRFKCGDSTALFYLAQQQLKIGRYKDAETNFKAYLEIFPNDELARNGLESCKLGPEWKAEPNQYSIKKDKLFNGRRSDYSPVLGGDDSDQIYFTSTRNQASGDEISGITGVKSADIFMARKDEQGKWKQVEEIEGGLNTEYDEGACCLSPDGKTMYLTVCSSDPDYPRYAEIHASKRSDANWGKPTKCEISRDTLSSYAHPAVSPDGEWLYFVSDMPGGIGGLDIWRTRILKDGFGGVENLGRPINTPGDEMFPTFRPNGELYFSSNGHPGMGGLDLFKAECDSTGKWRIENLRAPMNSAGDDFGMTFEGPYNRGYFCSNRNDGKGWDHIFAFENPEITQMITGWVYEKDGYELPEALVYMVGNDGTNLKLSVKMDGSFTQMIKPGVDYVLLGTCPGYLNVKQEISIPAYMRETVDSVLQFPLPPISIPVLIDNIFYEFDKATLTPESTEALDRLVLMMKENANITIELSSHCDYRGNDEYNKRLSQRRAESVVRYLIKHGVAKDRLTAMGYGETRPKIIRKKLTETYQFLNENDTLTEEFIKKLSEEEQEICNALNRRTEFRVLRTTYGMTLKEIQENAIKGTQENNARPRDDDEADDDFLF